LLQSATESDPDQSSKTKVTSNQGQTSHRFVDAPRVAFCYVAFCPNRGTMTQLESKRSDNTMDWSRWRDTNQEWRDARDAELARGESLKTAVAPFVRQWESRLAAEGLAELQPGSAVSSKARGLSTEQVTAYVSAVEKWQTWAKTVLDRHPFVNAHQRHVWELHATGTPMREIPGLVAQRRCDRRDGRGSSRASVERIIAAVNAAYPDRPRNPWSSPIVHKTRDELLADYPPPARSLPAEELRALPYQPPERKTTLMQRTYKYDLIMFNSARRIRVPGRDFANDRLANVEGTPHAGGIDVIMDAKVITVSWGSIAYCLRNAESASPVSVK
jgi:hypothetical protein